MFFEQWKLKRRFYKLKSQWKKDTCMYSLMDQIANHYAYQEIINMGPKAIPLIMNDLKKNGPQHWYTALATIVGASPILTAHRGCMHLMMEDWLNWWKYAERDFRKKHNL